MTDRAPMSGLPDDAVRFDSGGRMPLLGFGTWRIKGQEATTATAAALEAGYRLIDTATIYGNEAEVGQGMRDSGVAREDVFVTTKCPPDLAGRELDTLRRSLDSLGTDYVDLWLIHWPADHGASLDMWRAFIEAREAGLARDIGVSNFGIDMVDDLTSATGVAPV
ncbi:MAG: aldo/keto reductase, partial [Nocardioidaceae bacterium]